MSFFKIITDMCDVVSAVISCESDNTLMLVVDTFEHWIPSVKVPAGHSWERAMTKEVLEVSYS